MEGNIVSLILFVFFGGGTLLQVLSPSNWYESFKLLFHLVSGGLSKV